MPELLVSFILEVMPFLLFPRYHAHYFVIENNYEPRSRLPDGSSYLGKIGAVAGNRGSKLKAVQVQGRRCEGGDE